VDASLTSEFGGERYATALLAELDTATGTFTWVNAGHPEPLLLRAGRLVKTLEVEPATPLGIPFGAGPLAIGREQLEPGDRLLLHTDGLPEARLPDGGFFTVQRLADFVERESGAGHSAPETLRRLRRAVLEYQDGKLQDDATAVLLEWRGQGQRLLLPATVPGRQD